MNDAVKHVASRGTPDLSWERSQLLEGDVVQAVAALKEQDGPELQVHGSLQLLQTLLPSGLIDQLRLVRSATSATGVVMSVHEPAGAVTTGWFDLG